MAKEYIERNLTIKRIETLEPPVFYADGNLDWFQDGFKEALRQVAEILENQSNADVQEVRHGKNVTPINPVDEFECSECGFICEIYENIYDDEHTLDCQRECNPDFCPHCGAKMDKEG